MSYHIMWQLEKKKTTLLILEIVYNLIERKEKEKERESKKEILKSIN